MESALLEASKASVFFVYFSPRVRGMCRCRVGASRVPSAIGVGGEACTTTSTTMSSFKTALYRARIVRDLNEK